MMGGLDIQELGPVSREDVDLLLRRVRIQWPDAILETADGASTLSLGDALKEPMVIPCEFFLYETHDAYEAWTRDGYTEEYRSSMVSVFVEADCIAFVVDAPDSQSHELVLQALEAIRTNRRAFMKAA